MEWWDETERIVKTLGTRGRPVVALIDANSRLGSEVSPHSPKTWRTPWTCNMRTMASAPVSSFDP